MFVVSPADFLIGPISLFNTRINDYITKRIKIKSLRHKYKVGGFEAGLVKGSNHPRNNIYLRITGRKRQVEEFDFTVDEAAAIASALNCAIMDWTHDKRDLLKP